ncbi:MAG: hypothetical protein ABUT39_00945 [Acidobacteriota bacterium]
MALPYTSYINCRLVEYLGYQGAGKELVGGASYIPIWKKFVEVLNSYHETGQFIARALDFLRDIPGIDLPRPHEGDHNSADFTRAAEVVNSSLSLLADSLESRGSDANVLPQGNITIDSISCVLCSYYMSQIAYLLGEYEAALDCAATCFRWIKRAEFEEGKGLRASALFYYRYLLMALLFEISLHRGSFYTDPELVKDLQVDKNRPSRLVKGLFDAIFANLRTGYDEELKRYLSFALSPKAGSTKIPEGGTSGFERCYALSAKLRVAIEQFHEDKYTTSLANLQHVIEEAEGTSYLECYAKHGQLYRGRIETRRGYYQEAIADLVAVEEYFRELGNVFGEMRCWRHRAEVLEEQYKYREAEHLLTDTIDRCLEHSYLHDLGMSYWARGRAKTRSHRQHDALSDFLCALHMFRDYTSVDNVIDLVFWCAVALCRWHDPRERRAKLAEGRGYLIARHMAQRVLNDSRAKDQSMVLKERVLTGRGFDELLFSIVAGTLKDSLHWCDYVRGTWNSSPPSFQVERERLIVGLVWLQDRDDRSVSLLRNLTTPGKAVKGEARKHLAHLLAACADASFPKISDSEREEIEKRARSLMKSIRGAGIIKGIVNLLDEFSFYFVSRQDFLALVIICIHCLHGRLPLSRRKEGCWRIELLRESSEFLNRERLTRLDSCDFRGFGIGRAATPLAQRLTANCDGETFAGLYRSYAQGICGYRFTDPRLGIVLRADGAASVQFYAFDGKAVHKTIVDDISIAWLERAGCDIPGCGLIVQVWHRPNGTSRWLVLPLSDIRTEELRRDEAVMFLYGQLSWEMENKVAVCGSGEIEIDKSKAEEVARSVWNDFLAPALGIDYADAISAQESIWPRVRPTPEGGSFREEKMIPQVAKPFLSESKQPPGVKTKRAAGSPLV